MALDSEHKVRSILWYVLVGIVVILALAWLWAGGWANIKAAVAGMPNPLDIIWGTSTSTYQIRLPWQIDVPQGPDISGLAEDGNNQSSNRSSGDSSARLSDLQSRYDSLSAQARDPRLKGAPSPAAGLVTISVGGATDGSGEYIELDGHGGGANISGWVVESALAGKRAIIPQAAQPFVLGQVNRVAPVVLGSGEVAYVATGPSPLGVSFRETMCTGFLAQSQEFTPSLANACPSPARLLPPTQENLQTFGSDCVDYVASQSACTFPTNVPASLSPACRAFVANALSYNGCVAANQSRVGFARETWRLYLGIAGDLWDNRHDVIRLLDSEGRIVDAVSY